MLHCQFVIVSLLVITPCQSHSAHRCWDLGLHKHVDHRSLSYQDRGAPLLLAPQVIDKHGCGPWPWGFLLDLIA